MLPDVGAIGRVFDYSVPPAMDDGVRVGTIVRVELHGRRVRGWVVDDDRSPPPGVRLKPLAKVTGWGPPPALVALSEWAAWRWAGPRTALLGAASAEGAVPSLPPPPAPVPPATVAIDPAVAALVREALAAGGGIVRLPPAVDAAAVAALVVADRGPSLVLDPTHAGAARVARTLARQGAPVALLPQQWAAARAGGATVVGSRGAAWAPIEAPAAVVVLDAHDEGYQEQRAPTWHAVDVLIERAKRLRVPLLLVSPCPDVITLAAARRPPRTLSRRDERDGWPVLEVIDRTGDDPRTGLYSDRLVTLARRAERVVLVLNRKGRARLLACGPCGALARCERCGAALSQHPDAGGLACARCGMERPALCADCGSTNLRVLRVGVTRAREELEALLHRPVAEVTAGAEAVPDAPVLIGTEAVLHRVGRADLVAFLELDQELLAPRYRAPEEALALLALAARLAGGRRGSGRVAVQTRLPRAEVVAAALHGDPARVAAVEAPKREALGFPPALAVAVVSGAAAEVYVERLRGAGGVEVLGPADGRWLVRARDHRRLCDTLAGVERPAGRLRVEVDPRRL